MEFLPAALYALKSYNQFILYRLVPSTTRAGKTDKLPTDYRTLHTANAHDPAIWMSADQAIATAKLYGSDYGVGFVFTEADPFWFLDIDDCLQDGAWSPLATYLLSELRGCAVEVSSSQRGLHIFGSGGELPPHTCRNTGLKIELYDSHRFVALTGIHSSGDISHKPMEAMQRVIDLYFNTAAETSTSWGNAWTTEACPEWNGSLDDHELIGRMLRSKSAAATFGGERATFRDLWEANEAVLSVAYPSGSGDPFDRSAADAALVQHLAFWTGNNCERMQTLMMQSALARDKYSREDYLPRTILGACGKQKKWLYDEPPKNSPPPTASQADEPVGREITGNTFLTVPEQQIRFKGCVYVLDEHRVFVPGGDLLRQEQFRVKFGGATMMLDNKNEKTTRNAWEAFTESQAIEPPKASTTCFRPDLKPGSIIEEEGRTLVNIYWPVPTLRMVGSVDRILNHMALLVPNARDHSILLSYMCAVVQYMGVKFPWCPVIQGVEGNGKSLLTQCLTYAVGKKYTHLPKAAELDNRFNDWLYGRILIGIEDIYTTENRTGILEAMKPMITNQLHEIEAKGGVKTTRNVCANFIINTNHKDGIKKSAECRRYAVFFTAQQTLSDLHRDGMTGDYFPLLYRWLEKQNGFAMFNEFMRTYAIPQEFDPTKGANRAPLTSSTDAAISQSAGRVEQEIEEACALGEPGFRNGWVSSTMLEILLERISASRLVPRNKRKDLLASLGYIPHPVLKEGRAIQIVAPDGKRPTLYVKKDHGSLVIQSQSEVCKRYEQDQK